MVNNVPMQGDIIMIDVSPRKGNEQEGHRPYICLSNKVISDFANIAIFAPITTTKRKYPFYIPLEGCGTTGVVMLDQITAIDYKARDFYLKESVSNDVLLPLLRLVPILFQYNGDDGTPN